MSEWKLKYSYNRRFKRQEDYIIFSLLLSLFKSDESCADCKKKFPPECMDFDHIRGDKEFLVSEAETKNPQRVQKEVEKCELVCSNCHRIRTKKRKVNEN